jgi:hypothetical protein
MDGTAILDAILDVAKAAAPLVGNGAPQAIELGKRVIELIDHVQEDFQGAVAGSDMAKLSAERDALEQRVNDHVNRTVGKLRG